MPIPPHRIRQLLWGLPLLLLLPGLTGCSVAFYERRHLADPIMSFEEDPGETHFLQKCTYSREGSAGGIGASAGGGCGCY